MTSAVRHIYFPARVLQFLLGMTVPSSCGLTVIFFSREMDTFGVISKDTWRGKAAGRDIFCPAVNFLFVTR